MIMLKGNRRSRVRLFIPVSSLDYCHRSGLIQEKRRVVTLESTPTNFESQNDDKSYTPNVDLVLKWSNNSKFLSKG